MRLLISSVFICLLAGAQTLGTQRAESIHVGPNVQVSADDQQTPHWEVLGCVDPSGSGRMVIGSMVHAPGNAFHEDGTHLATTRVYTSADDGRSWKLTYRSNDARSIQDMKGDPSCAFDAEGGAYYAHLGQVPDGARMELFRSSDGGNTWTSVATPTVNDRPFLVVDTTGASSRGTLYSVDQAVARSVTTAPGPSKPGDAGDAGSFMTGLRVSTSVDRGDHFSSQTRFAFGNGYLTAVARPVVLADGTMVAAFLSRNDRRVSSARDSGPIGRFQTIRVTSQGRVMEPAVTVAESPYPHEQGNHLPVLAADPGSRAFHGRIYIAWIDTHSGRARVVLSYSSDGGRSWTRPRVVDDPPGEREAQQAPRATSPSIAVNRRGVVAIGWADRREHADNFGWNYRVAASYDGGETFTPSVKGSTAAQTFPKWPLFVVPQYAQTQLPDRVIQEIIQNSSALSAGHTVDMLVDRHDVFHPVWLDNRTGRMQIWTAPVTVEGAAHAPDTTALEGFVSVRSVLRLETHESTYDPATQLAVLDTRVINTSSAPVALPIKVQVSSLSSDIGTVEILNAENGARGAGAIWTFTGARGTDRELPPGAETATFKLQVRVVLTDPANRPYEAGWRLFRYEARLLAPREVQ